MAGELTLAARIGVEAGSRSTARALVGVDHTLTWSDYDRLSDRIACQLVGLGLDRGDRVAVILPDGPLVHAVYVGAEKAGVVVMGIGPRAGEQEVRHLVHHSGADVAITAPGDQRLCAATRHMLATLDPGPAGSGLHEVNATGDVVPLAAESAIEGRAFGSDELFFLNSTSGTTGLPKCVMHDQSRWLYFHRLAIEAGEMTSDDVFMSLIAAPFGFGLWTSHFTPALLGSHLVALPRFSTEPTLELIERERVTVLACVSTQFVMLLNSPAFDRYDLSSLRMIFTGGEAVSYGRAAEWEQRSGSRVLQFYGSNETGALSRTTLRDSRERRLGTAGRVIEDMQVRLLDEAGDDVPAGRPGQPACRGPATCLGYYRDEAANEALLTPDGWTLTGDVAEIDADGYLRVVGRASDFIIRGGKNISAKAVEDHVGAHPTVAMVAAVAQSDEVFGERVCAFVTLRPGSDLDLVGLSSFLAERGVSRDLVPERLVVVEGLPRSSGGKVAKAELRRWANEGTTP